jgi:hypothetical protein
MRTALKTGLILLVAWTVHAQMPGPQRKPGGPGAPGLMPQNALDDFAARISRYLELRAKLGAGLSGVTGADDPAHVRSVEVAWAQRIRSARARARQGDVFSPQVAAAVREILRQQMDAGARKTIMDDNPGAFSNHVNDSYPKARPLSTVPPGLLMHLPKLPDDLQYRFVGADLILHDTRTNLIVDRLPEAISRGGPSR